MNLISAHIYHGRQPKAGALGARKLVSQVVGVLSGYGNENWKNTAFLRHAERMMNMGSWELDLRTRRGVWSKGLYRITGISEGQPVTAESFLSIVHPEDRHLVVTSTQDAIERHTCFQHSYRVIRPGGETRHLSSRGEPVYDPGGSAVRLIGICRDLTQRRLRQQHSSRAKAAISRKLMQTRDDDRRQLASQLHETVGQSLAALRMTLGQLADLLRTESPELKTLLQAANQLADEAIRETRTISYVMHPPMLDERGLEPALQWYVRGFAQRSGIAVESDIQSGLGRFPREIETGVFRVVQEALTNVHRHSSARSAKVTVWSSASHLMAVISDSGRGLPRTENAEHPASPPGVGIADMRERVVLLHGEFEIASKPGEGTRVRVSLPTSPGSSITGQNGRQI